MKEGQRLTIMASDVGLSVFASLCKPERQSLGHGGASVLATTCHSGQAGTRLVLMIVFAQRQKHEPCATLQTVSKY